MDAFEMIEKAEKILRDNHLFAEVWEHLGMLCVSIEWGDWKHSHLRAKYLLEQNGFKKVLEKVTDEDGSDCFSAEHYFIYEA
jgi:hypothetical protein